MTMYAALHKSATHREGFDPNCPQCLTDQGLQGVIRHLEVCAEQNSKDANRDRAALAVAHEQRRVTGILKLYRKVRAAA